MTIETNLNQSPFFDDFNEDKNFHRVLFRPGYAVQARELTQLQTILQNQVSRLGSTVLTDGTVVSGCDLELPKWQYVKLRDKDANNRVLLLNDFYSNALIANSTITGETTGVTAKLLAASEGSEGNAPNYLSVFVSYTNSGANNTTKAFSDNETLIFRNSANSEFIVAANTIVTGSTGTGIGGSLAAGVVYHKGHFVKVPQQAGVVSKYSVDPTVRVGLETEESIIDSNQDSSLLDNASGATNFSAPGASRLKLSPVLKTRDATSANNIGFVPLADIQSGRVIREYLDPSRGNLADELATRTREESGDYAIRPFKVNVEEHLKTEVNGGVYSAAESGDLNKLVIEVNPSIGYVSGYRTELSGLYRQDIDKAITYLVQKDVVVGQAFGNYAICNEVVGTWDFQGFRDVDIYDTAQQAITNDYVNAGSALGAKVGTAKVRGFQHHEGTSGTPSGKFRIYLFDIKMTAGNAFSNSLSLYVANVSGPHSYADIVLETDGKARLQDTALNKLVMPIQSSGTRKLADATDNTNTQYVFRTEKTVSFTTAGTATVSANTAHTGGTETNNDTGSPLSSVDERNIIIVARSEVSTNPMTGQASQSGSTVTGSAGATFTSQYNVGDFIQLTGETKQRITNIAGDTTMTVSGSATVSATGHAKVFPIGHIFDTQANGTITSTGSAHSIDLETANLASTFAASVYFDVLRTSAVQANKTVNKNKFVHIDTGSHTSSNVGPWPLGVSDAFRLLAVYSGGNTTVSTSDTNVTSEFYIEGGQRDSMYDTARLIKRSTSTLNTTDAGLLVKFDYFGRDRSAGIGFLSVDSYPVNDANPLANTTITTQEIPKYLSASGEIIDLRDSVDFRPIRSSTATPSSTGTAAAAPTNPAQGSTFDVDSDGSYFPTPDQNFQADVQSYLPRFDRVVLTSTGVINVVSGTPDQFPQVPTKPKDTMVLANVFVPPYPSLSPDAALYYLRPESEVMVNEVDNKRFTMKELRVLEHEVKKHHYMIVLNTAEIAALKKGMLRPSDPVTAPEPPVDSIIIDPPPTGEFVNSMRSSDLSFAAQPLRAIPTLQNIELSLSSGGVNTTVADDVVTVVESSPVVLIGQTDITSRLPVTVNTATPAKLYNGTMRLSHPSCSLAQPSAPAQASVDITDSGTTTSSAGISYNGSYAASGQVFYGGCFVAGTLVYMGDGSFKAIESVVIGDVVLGMSGEFNTVVALHHHPVEARTIYTINDSLELTDTHPMLTIDGWKSFNAEKTRILHPDLEIVGQLAFNDQMVKYDKILGTYTETLNDFSQRQETGHVFNLDVDRDDTFIVNGFVVHNK